MLKLKGLNKSMIRPSFRSKRHTPKKRLSLRGSST